MAQDTSPFPARPTTTGESHRRWDDLLDNLASLLPAGATSVVIDGPGGQPRAVADRLAAALRAAGRPCSRLADTAAPAADPDPTGLVVLADGPGWRTARGADAGHLPLASASADAVFAAGLIMHLPDTEAGLRQLARITRPGGLLILFHPSGRAALAARHGRTLEPDEPLAEAPLQRLTQSTGWRLTTYDDAECRFLAIAARG